MKKIPRIALTMGDPAGIGPEILLKAYQHPLPRHVPIVFGDPSILKETAGWSPARRIYIINRITNSLTTSAEGINLLPITNLSRGSVRPGHVDAITGQAAGRYIEAAIRAALEHQVDAVVTCPIHKRAFHQGGYSYPGHTEMFAELTKSHSYTMMMASSPLKVALTTIHLP